MFESVGRSQCWKLKRRAFGAEAKVVESRSEELTQGSVNVSREKKAYLKTIQINVSVLLKPLSYLPIKRIIFLHL